MKDHTSSTLTKWIVASAASIAMIGISSAQSCPPQGSSGNTLSVAYNFQNAAEDLHRSFDRNLAHQKSKCTYTRQLHSEIDALDRHSGGVVAAVRRRSASGVRDKMRNASEALRKVKILTYKLRVPSRSFNSNLTKTTYAYNSLENALRSGSSNRYERSDRNGHSSRYERNDRYSYNSAPERRRTSR